MKKFNLTEEQFVLLTENSVILRNDLIKELEKCSNSELLTRFYQGEIDRVNDLFDSLNKKFKTNF
jgi:hypothetical protein